MSAEIQGYWLRTGEIAQENGIVKWGVVAAGTPRQMTVRYLLRGGNGGSRTYQRFVSDSLRDVLEWIREPTPAEAGLVELPHNLDETFVDELAVFEA